MKPSFAVAHMTFIHQNNRFLQKSVKVSIQKYHLQLMVSITTRDQAIQNSEIIRLKLVSFSARVLFLIKQR